MIHSSNETFHFSFNSSFNCSRNFTNDSDAMVQFNTALIENPFVQIALIKEILFMNLVLVTAQLFPFSSHE